MITVPARILKKPMLQYNGKGRDATVVPRDGSWNLANKKFFKPAAIRRWGVMILNQSADNYGKAVRGDRNEVKGLFEYVMQVLQSYGITFGNFPDKFEANLAGLGLATRADNEATIDKVFKQMVDGQYDLALVIIKNADRWLYSRIKYYGDVVHG